MSPDSGGSGTADAPVVDMTPCTTTFHFTPSSPAGNVSVTGDWNAFADPNLPMVGPDANGALARRR